MKFMNGFKLLFSILAFLFGIVLLVVRFGYNVNDKILTFCGFASLIIGSFGIILSLSN